MLQQYKAYEFSFQNKKRMKKFKGYEYMKKGPCGHLFQQAQVENLIYFMPKYGQIRAFNINTKKIENNGIDLGAFK